MEWISRYSFSLYQECPLRAGDGDRWHHRMWHSYDTVGFCPLFMTHSRYTKAFAEGKCDGLLDLNIFSSQVDRIRRAEIAAWSQGRLQRSLGFVLFMFKSLCPISALGSSIEIINHIPVSESQCKGHMLFQVTQNGNPSKSHVRFSTSLAEGQAAAIFDHMVHELLFCKEIAQRSQFLPGPGLLYMIRY